MVNEVRVPAEWVEEANDALDALYEANIDLDPVSVVFKDEERYDVPAGYSLHFEEEIPFEDAEPEDK